MVCPVPRGDRTGLPYVSCGHRSAGQRGIPLGPAEASSLCVVVPLAVWPLSSLFSMVGLHGLSWVQPPSTETSTVHPQRLQASSLSYSGDLFGLLMTGATWDLVSQ